MTDTTHIELAMAERETPLMLVVDDDVVIRSMIKKALQNQAYDVVEAPNGSEGVEMFRKLHPDLVLLDVLMPMMDGFAACSAMRKHDPERTVPIIMLTGLDDVTSVDRSFDAGATDFITKPINWSLFSQRVRYSLRTREMDFELRKNQLRIRHALQVARLGYWDWDVRSDQFYLPPGVLEMLGINLGGKQFGFAELLPFVVEEDRDRVKQAFMDARNKGQRFEIRHRIQVIGETERYVFQ
ncbi:MAG TPA: response regulator, partial [Gammaproteobacteria bacterium]|nr:response regulator [Gammaproteobacteria bacterium]